VRYHSNRRGYIACTATRAQMRADFKILDSVTVPDRPHASAARSSSRRDGAAAIRTDCCDGQVEREAFRRASVARLKASRSSVVEAL